MLTTHLGMISNQESSGFSLRSYVLHKAANSDCGLAHQDRLALGTEPALSLQDSAMLTCHSSAWTHPKHPLQSHTTACSSESCACFLWSAECFDLGQLETVFAVQSISAICLLKLTRLHVYYFGDLIRGYENCTGKHL